MRALRVIAAVVAVLVCIAAFLWFLPNLVNPQYFGLRHKSARWYVDFTAACDAILTAHPLGTNDAVWIPITDPSIPKIIRDLHPLKLQVNPERVWMLMVSDSHAGFGLTWDPQWDDTNVWVLHTTAESLDTVVYSTTRSASPNKHMQPTPR